MKTLFAILAIGGLVSTASLQAQEMNDDATTYHIDLFGSASTGDYTPFWMTNNTNGIVPLDANNGYLRAAVQHSQHFGKGFYWNAMADIIGAVPRYRNVFIQQLYAEIGYKSLLLSVGSKENHTSLWDNNLGMGDMVISNNANPIPEINISMPRFTVVPLTKGLLQVKGDFAVGRSFDNKYLEDFAAPKQYYVKDVLWHHKSFYVQIKDTKSSFPISGIIGLQHWAQWGGTSTDPAYGAQPHSFKDFIRTVLGLSGNNQATVGDEINVLGNHYGAYNFKLQYTAPTWDVAAYYQHYFDDNSAMEFVNGTDGLWGMEANFQNFPWIRRVVGEYLTTMNQSGPMHFILYDHSDPNIKGPGGGNDNYYNNFLYLQGVSYMGRALGNPMLTSPMYNKDGSIQFRNNRVQAWNLGLEGDLSKQVSYRIKGTIATGYGTCDAPYLVKKHTVSLLAEASYTHPHLKGWQFKGAIATDHSTLTGNTTGFSLTVSKRGILKEW